jgi:hypothetical protein
MTILTEGTEVLFNGKPARIIRCINATDPADLAAQGARYYVSQRGQTWSAGARELVIKVQQNQGVKSG